MQFQFLLNKSNIIPQELKTLKEAKPAKHTASTSPTTTIRGWTQNSPTVTACHSGGPPRKDEMGNWRLGSLDYLKFWVQPTAFERNRRFSIYFRL